MSYDWEQAGRIRCLRNYLGLSAAEMAATLKMSIRSYQNFESGRAAIPTGVLDEVADLVHQLDELAGEFSEREVLTLKGMSTFELRAAAIAAAAKPGLRVEP